MMAEQAQAFSMITERCNSMIAKPCARSTPWVLHRAYLRGLLLFTPSKIGVVSVLSQITVGGAAVKPRGQLTTKPHAKAAIPPRRRLLLKGGR